MLRKIDRVGRFDIQKITKPDGKFLRYQVIESDKIGRELAKEFLRLGEARQFATVVSQNEVSE